MAKVVISRQAFDQLADIYDFVAQDSPSSASSLVSELEEACYRLQTLPERGRLYGKKHQIVFSGRYRIVYHLDKAQAAKMVTIVAVQHTARNLSSEVW